MTDRIDPKAIADELRRQASPSAIQRDLFARAADTIDSLASQLAYADRQFTALKESSGKSDARSIELAAVVEKVKNLAAEAGRFRESDVDTWVNVYALKKVLYAAPADALAEHDATLIEGLADDLIVTVADEAPDDFLRGMDYAADDAMTWLRERARLIREGDKK